ncbi:hypothetical protein LAZ67_21001743 [Cordylochernes scorpioides]|uniref:Reverse transcriptase domain-containing protein n=1 Tax=Cordylochernes scorpioides TaxID=51811 RepID=A0ABY6LMF4_9ARAC|nr:hypothetical protein LAZ67_21001743 [Cordylochernes scorpioides]
MNLSTDLIERYKFLIHKKSLQLAKWRCHLRFNQLCEQMDFIPPSLRLKDPVRNPFSAQLIKRTQRQLLRTRTKGCYSNIRFLSKSIKGLIFLITQNMDIAILTSFIEKTTTDVKALEQNTNRKHNQKLEFWSRKYAFPLQRRNTDHEVPNVINLSDITLSPAENRLLSKGLKYRIPAKVDTPRLISGIEASIRTLSHQDQWTIRNQVTRTLQRPLPPLSVSRLEHKIIRKLKSQRSIVITRSDKGSDTVIINQTEYHTKMTDILNDTTTFTQISAEESKASTKNFRVSLNRMKRSASITIEDHKNFTSNMGTNAYIYGLPKIHKPSVPLRPVIAYHLSPAYPLAKHLTNLLTPLWNNNRRAFTTPNSTSFIQDITNLLPPPNSSMCSFDVSSLFLSLPHSLMIDNLHQFLSSIHTDATIANNIISLTKICLCMNTFTYSHTHFKQIRGTPMGSPLSSILSEITMSTIDQWICNRQPSNIFFWRRYVDDIFCVCKTDSENTIFTDLHTYNPNITFTLEREHELVIPFLDVLVIRTPNTYHTTVYYKKNHPPRYTHYRSHCPTSHKINIVKALTRRLLTHCSLPIFKTIEKNHIISHLTISGFPLSFIEKHTYSPVPLNPPATYKSTCVIPFSPLSVNLSRFLKPFGIRTFFTNTPNLHSLLRHPITKTDSSTDPLTSGAVYSVSCQQCPATYVGETVTHEKIELVRFLLKEDRRITFQQLEKSVGIGSAAINTIINDHLYICKPVKVDRMTEDSNMQRMTEAEGDYVADALTNMQPHCENRVSHLTDAIRGLTIPRTEEVIIAPGVQSPRQQVARRNKQPGA